MKKSDAAKVVAVLLAAYPNSKITAQTSHVYEEALSDLDYESVDRAVRALIMTEKDFMPTPAKIRDMALEILGTIKRHGGDAFGDVRKLVGRFGRDRGPEAMAVLQERDPIAALVMDRMGWREFCNSDEGDSAFRARFIQLYDLFTADRKRIEATGGLLTPPRTTPELGRPDSAGDAASRVLESVRNRMLPAGKKGRT